MSYRVGLNLGAWLSVEFVKKASIEYRHKSKIGPQRATCICVSLIENSALSLSLSLSLCPKIKAAVSVRDALSLSELASAHPA